MTKISQFKEFMILSFNLTTESKRYYYHAIAPAHPSREIDAMR